MNIKEELRKLNRKRPTFVVLSFLDGHHHPHERRRHYRMPLTLQVGESKTALVTVLDQNGAPITNFDFTANAPSWSIDQPAVVSLATGTTPQQEIVTGVSAGTATLSVSVPGVANPSANDPITLQAPPPPPPVPSSVQITYQ